MVDRLYDWLDDRLNLSTGGRKAINKIFPDHWSFMIGEIALYSFVVLLATGVFLTLYFVPSTQQVTYTGPYVPLIGQKVSLAYESTVNMAFAVRGGDLMREMHHWAANIFVGAIVVHMGRVFFTGAFRRPREINWLIGMNLLILAIFNGFLGYSLPDDLVSGTGIRIALSILESIPLVGTYLASFLFGGQFPGNALIPRFFIIHVLILPAVIAGLLGAHLTLLVRQKHTQFRGHGATEHNVVGAPMWPTFIAKTQGFLFLVAGVTAILGAAVQINPIWLYGPYVPYHVTYAVQPDWYMGWLDGGLRIMPSWELTLGPWHAGFAIPNAFFPAVVLPGIVFTAAMLWPFIEQRITGDRADHQILDRPRDRPKRTAAGVAVFSFLLVLFGASATDVLANYLTVSLNTVLVAFRILVIAVPLIAYPITYRICIELQGTHRGSKTKRHNIVLRSPEGGYMTVEVAARPGDTPLELDPVALDHSVVVGAAVATLPREAADRSGLGARANAAATNGDGVNGDGAGGEDDRARRVFRIPRSYR
ncbi:MAG TPA: cytochrome bc complex cytochrome b subunit [Acidimicrobiales bacterium]|nr:cytochrome bc complex cytochrome b subunit [Acidimicrobiales bacterium]